MSLHIAAKYLASKGRDGDSTLVHMSPGEVRGLQALAMAHGGSLSINPDTGLVEASFLKRILPMVAGAALAATGIGAPMAALMVGGGTTLVTGDIRQGLMAGLGAYGGAGLGSGLMGAAGNSGAAGAAEALSVPSSAMPVNAATGLPTAVASGPGSQAAMLAAENASMGLTPMQSAAQISGSAGYASGATSPSMLNVGSSLMRSGAQKLLEDPAEGAKAVYKAMPTGTLPALGSTLADAMLTAPQQAPGAQGEDPRYAGAPYRYNLSPNFSGFVPRQPQPYYRPTGLGYSGYAEGGEVMMAQGGSYDDEPMGDNPGMAVGGLAAYAEGGDVEAKRMRLGEGIYRDTDEDTASLGAYDAAKKRIEKQFAAANLKAKEMPKSGIARLGQIKTMAEGGLGSYSDGGRMLKGPGDGMSDDIPAVIGRKQPARLADGEFVVPADVVSHLGNGSTDAGAKKLYSMMDKVRTARTGKKKQAPAVKADKYMPA